MGEEQKVVELRSRRVMIKMNYYSVDGELKERNH